MFCSVSNLKQTPDRIRAGKIRKENVRFRLDQTGSFVDKIFSPWTENKTRRMSVLIKIQWNPIIIIFGKFNSKVQIQSLKCSTCIISICDISSLKKSDDLDNCGSFLKYVSFFAVCFRDFLKINIKSTYMTFTFLCISLIHWNIASNRYQKLYINNQNKIKVSMCQVSKWSSHFQNLSRISFIQNAFKFISVGLWLDKTWLLTLFLLYFCFNFILLLFWLFFVIANLELGIFSGLLFS